MNVIWTDTATNQLVALRDFLAKGSPGYAQTFAAQVVRASEGLLGRPHFGAEVPEYGDPNIREIFVHPARVIYSPDGADIRILSVIHHARRLPRTPPS